MTLEAGRSDRLDISRSPRTDLLEDDAIVVGARCARQGRAESGPTSTSMRRCSTSGRRRARMAS